MVLFYIKINNVLYTTQTIVVSRTSEVCPDFSITEHLKYAHSSRSITLSIQGGVDVGILYSLNHHMLENYRRKVSSK